MGVICPKCQHENPDDTLFCGKCATPLKSAEGISITKTIITPATGLQKGSTIAGRYKIMEELGRGGMGVVYKAQDNRLDRSVALKFLPPEITRDDEAKQRFVQEAKAAAALNHPQICTIYEVDEVDNQSFISMEYIEGQNLKNKLKSGPLDIDEAQSIVIQVAEGLKEAHEKGIVHRDIKPANIMLAKKGQVKITDFGLAKLSWGANLTKTSTTMGTAAYMSPEQAKGEEVDHRTDIWSLGAMLFEMLSGCLPFQGDHESAMIHSVIYEEPQDIKELCPGCPSVLADIITTCLQKETENRFTSMQEILGILEGKVPSKKVGAQQRKHNLPVQLTSFVGRRQEIETIRKLLSENRLITLTGAGGCGKTRLAIEVAATLVEEYEDGIWFVDLGPVKDPKFVAMEISEVLDIKEEPKKAIIDTLIENVKNMSLLILLDNCEHLVQVCADISERLLQSNMEIRIMATSREPLSIPGEVVWRIPSLSFPDNGASMGIDEALCYEAITLFTERARTGKPGFSLNPQNVSSVIGICQRLEGIPLAIELAATRIRHLGPETILERLEDQMNILASSRRTAPERQQTLEATIDWSYNLLAEEEQRLFNRLSVFTGDFSLEAVEEICTDHELKKENILPLLSQLVDKSLVIAEDQKDESVRYRCLAPLQQYSLQKFKESGEVEKYRMHHLSYFLKIAEQAYEERLESQSLWLNRLVAEHTNIIAALKWSDNQSPNEFVRLSGALGWFWWMRSHFLLGKDYLEKALLKKIDKSEEYARSLLGLGMILWFTGDNQSRSVNLLNESLDIWHQSNNLQEAAYVLAQLSFSHHIFGDHETGIKCSEQSLDSAEITRNPMLINHCLTALCTSLICMKKFDQAKPMAEKLLVSSEELKQPYGLLRAHHYISDCALAGRNFKDAEKKYGLAVKTSIKYGDIVQATHDLHGVAFSISGQSRWAKAIRLNGAVCEKYRTMGISMPGTITFWHEWIDIYIEGAKKQVGEELTRKYEEEGRNMGFEAAVEYALDFDKD